MITKRRSRVRLRLLAAALVLIGLLGGGWLWLRDSSLVAVRHVTITGVSGPDAGQIRSVLTLAARNMTTLDVRVGQLRTAVAPYTVVKSLRVSTQFPHGLRIRVLEQLPVAALVAGGRSIAASGDGTVLHDVASGSLPAIPVPALPAGSQVTDRAALDALALLAETPRRLLGHIAHVTTSPPHGLVVQLRTGPSLYFGNASDADAKWMAATAVLADPSSDGASYVDVTDPAHPAAGASPQAVAAAGLATGSGSSASGSAGPAATTGTGGSATGASGASSRGG
jgi:cell division protein FtsQ